MRYRVNRWIKSAQLRVIADGGEALGILSLGEALRAAEERGMDLVEVSPKSVPPVAKLMDYGKFKYTLEKRDREARKKQKSFALKEVKLRSKIDGHDFNFKRDHAMGFLRGGHKVKLTVMFFGREMTHVELGRAVLEKFIEELTSIGKLEVDPKLEGRNLSAIMVPKPNVLREAQIRLAALHGKQDHADKGDHEDHDVEHELEAEADGHAADALEATGEDAGEDADEDAGEDTGEDTGEDGGESAGQVETSDKDDGETSDDATDAPSPADEGGESGAIP